MFCPKIKKPTLRKRAERLRENYQKKFLKLLMGEEAYKEYEDFLIKKWFGRINVPVFTGGYESMSVLELVGVKSMPKQHDDTIEGIGFRFHFHKTSLFEKVFNFFTRSCLSIIVHFYLVYILIRGRNK